MKVILQQELCLKRRSLGTAVAIPLRLPLAPLRAEVGAHPSPSCLFGLKYRKQININIGTRYKLYIDAQRYSII